MYRDADQAPPTYDQVYLGGSKDAPLEGNYVLALSSWKAITVKNPTPGAYNGLATVLQFDVVESDQPGNPVGSTRSVFVKNDMYGPKTLRNLLVALHGYDESRDAAAINALISQHPLSRMQSAIASDPANMAGFKGRQVRGSARKKISKQGYSFVRCTFSPIQ